MTPTPDPLDAAQRSGLYRLIAEKEALRLLVEEALPWIEAHEEHHDKAMEDWLARARVLAQGKEEP